MKPTDATLVASVLWAVVLIATYVMQQTLPMVKAEADRAPRVYPSVDFLSQRSARG